MSLPFLLGTDYLRKIQSVRPESLVSLWPQNEPLGHAVSTEIMRQYNGAYTAVTLGQVGVQRSGLTSAGYNGLTSFNNIHSAGFAGDNLFLNGGYENPGGGGADIWADVVEVAGDGALANEVVIVHQGNDAAKMTSGASSNTGALRSFAVDPNTGYRFRFWTYGDGVNDGRFHVYDATNGAYISAVRENTGVTTAAWGMVDYEFRTPPGCVLIQIYQWCPGVNGGIAYFDAGEVRPKDAFCGDKGTVIVPARVANVGVWTDGVMRYAAHIEVDANNRFLLTKSAVNNRVDIYYLSGGVTVSHLIAGLTTLDFMTIGLTWDISAGATGEVRYFLDGIQNGATDVGLGTWVGDLSNTATLIGARTTVPAQVWSGNVAPVPIWSEALSPDEMRYLG